MVVPAFSFAQGESVKSLLHRKPFFDEIGFTTGFGFGSNPRSLPEGTYRPIYFMGYFAKNLLKKEFRKEARISPFYYSEPQFNLVYVQKPNGSFDQYYEFGINNGFKQNFKLAEFIHVFILIGTGPHYINIETANQRKGFIFSNCMGAGTQLFLKNNITLSIGFRIKHMSNLQLFLPNAGINSYNFHCGFSYIL